MGRQARLQAPRGRSGRVVLVAQPGLSTLWSVQAFWLHGRCPTVRRRVWPREWGLLALPMHTLRVGFATQRKEAPLTTLPHTLDFSQALVTSENWLLLSSTTAGFYVESELESEKCGASGWRSTLAPAPAGSLMSAGTRPRSHSWTGWGGRCLLPRFRFSGPAWPGGDVWPALALSQAAHCSLFTRFPGVYKGPQTWPLPHLPPRPPRAAPLPAGEEPVAGPGASSVPSQTAVMFFQMASGLSSSSMGWGRGLLPTLDCTGQQNERPAVRSWPCALRP